MRFDGKNWKIGWTSNNTKKRSFKATCGKETLTIQPFDEQFSALTFVDA